MKSKRGNAGFTLVEIVVTVAIIAILTGILAPQFTRYVEKSRTMACKSNLISITEAYSVERAMDMFLNTSPAPPPEGVSPEEKRLSEIMEDMGAVAQASSKPGVLEYANVCPAHGDVVTTFQDQGRGLAILQLICTEHEENMTFDYSTVITTAIRDRWNSTDPNYGLYRLLSGGETQTLKSYLSGGGKHVIDSEATAKVDGIESFTSVINKKVTSLSGQSWKLASSDNGTKIEFYVTKYGVLKVDDAPQTVNAPAEKNVPVIKFSYVNGVLKETDFNATAGVILKKGTEVNPDGSTSTKYYAALGDPTTE